MPQHEFTSAVMVDSGTPFGWGLADKQPCTIARGYGPFPLVFTHDQLRKVTEWQIRDHLKEGEPVQDPGEAAKALARTTQLILDSPRGIIGNLSLGKTYPLPKAFPLEEGDGIIEIAEGNPDFTQGWWLAEWIYLPNGKLKRVFQKRYIDVVERENAWDLVVTDKHHELAEATGSYADAVREYSQARAEQLGGLAWQFNGVNHLKVIKSGIEGMCKTEEEYENRLSAKLERRLGIKVNWKPVEAA